jgi:HPt (histidine-containing phosphotransfer) domain-containing protein
MSAPLGSADFFALEAGECLDHLEVLITQPDGSDAAQLLRYARALRGSALMANQTAIARAAAGFEALARAIRDGKRTMDAVTRERAAQAVEDVRQLVRRVKDWSDTDESRATRVASELAALAGGELGDPRRVPAPRGQEQARTGVRAFVAREGALVASALDRAARSLEATPEAREPLYAILRRMQSLRGLAELNELSPLPEVLDGIELAVGDLTRLFAPPAGVPELLDAGAAALTRIARDVADRGAPDPEAAEPRHFTERLLRAFASEDDVVPVERLLDGPPSEAVVRSSAQPQFAPPSPLGPVELVSHGEHLVQVAEQLMHAPTSTARDLRLFALVPAFRAGGSTGRDPVTPALSAFGRAACRSIASGAAAANLGEFAELLREAGGTLRHVADAGPTQDIGARLIALTRRLEAEPQPELVAEPPSRRAAEPVVAEPVTPVEAVSPPVPEPPVAEPPSDDAVPIESLDYDDVVPVLELAPSGPVPLERGFTRYHALIAGAGSAADAVVDIATLCYSGRGALERAAELRTEIAVRLQADSGLTAVEPLLLELLDLVPLALAGS